LEVKLCLEEIEQALLGAPVRAEVWGEEEVLAGWEVTDLGQAPEELAFALSVEQRFLTEQEAPVMIWSVLSVEQRWLEDKR
jgi:hypothetical protein